MKKTATPNKNSIAKERTIKSVREFFIFLALLMLAGTFANSSFGQDLTTIDIKNFGGQYDIPVAVKAVNNEKFILAISTAKRATRSSDGYYMDSDYDMYVVKLDSNENILYTSYIRANSVDIPVSMAVENGEVYILGYTSSNNFPVTDTSKFNTPAHWDMTVTRLNANGNIVFARYLGGNDTDFPKEIKVENGDIYTLGKTYSENYPVTNGSKIRKDYRTTSTQPGDLCYTKLSPAGEILFSTFLGTSEGDDPLFLRVENKYAYIVYESFDFIWGGWSHPMNYYMIKPDGTIGYKSTNNGSWTSTIDAEVENKALYISYKNYQTPYVLKLDNNGNYAYQTYMGYNSGNSGKIEVVNGEVYYAANTSEKTFPVTDTTKNKGGDDIVIAKLDATGEIVYGTQFGGKTNDYIVDIKVKNNIINISGQTLSTDFPVTNSSEFEEVKVESYTCVNHTLTQIDTSGYLVFSSYFGKGPVYYDGGSSDIDIENGNTFLLTYGSVNYSKTTPCPNFPTDNNTIAPLNQLTCKNGITEQLVGSKITVPNGVKNGVPINNKNVVEAKYQWQTSTNPSGPWKNILGSVTRNYHPKADTINRYYRRVAHKGSDCGNATISISPVAAIEVSDNISPKADAGGYFFTCPGARIQIGGVITAQGGESPYKYEWDNGAKPEPNPYVNPPLGTKYYNLTVIDANGCRSKDKAVVTTVKADAGPDKINACDKKPVRIGTAPKTFPMLSTSYFWKADHPYDQMFGIQPGDQYKAQLMVNPTEKTKYTLELTVFATNGGFCTTTDAIEVNPLARPKGIGIDSSEFAGRDTVLCYWSTAKIGVDVDTSKKFKYRWIPGSFLSADSIKEPIFDPGTLGMPSVNPITYYLTATQENCLFVDSLELAVIEANTGIGDCSTILGRGDETPAINDTFQWTKLWGDGNILSDPNKPKIIVDRGAATYQLKVNYNKKDCYATHIINTGEECHCLLEIIPSTSCPKYDPKDTTASRTTTLTATAGGSYLVTWEPTEGLEWYDHGLGHTVRLTDTIERTYTATAWNPIDNDKCVASIHVNNPNWVKPKFKAKKFREKRNKVINIGYDPGMPGYTYTWQGDGLSCNVCPNPQIQVTKMTKYPVTVSDGLGCETTDTVRVYVKIADAGPDKVVCEKDQVVQIGTPGYSQYDYSWFPSNASWQNGTNEFSAQPYVAVTDSNMVFILTVRDPETGDVDTDTMKIKIVKSGTFIEQSDVYNNVCKGSEVIIGLTSQTGATYEWTPSAGLKDPKASETIAKPDKTTTYKLTTTYPGGCKSEQKYYVAVIDPSFSLRDTLFCPSNGPLSLGKYAPAGMVAYHWTPEDSVSNPEIANPTTLEPPRAGIATYKLLVMDKYGCYANSSMKATSAASIPFAGRDTVMCKGSAKLLGSAANLGDEVWVIEAGPDTSKSQLGCTTCAQPLFTPNKAGTYVITASYTQNSCKTSSRVIITVSDFTLANTESREICAGKSVQIGWSLSGATVVWSPVTGLNNPTIGMPIAKPDLTTTYTAIITSTEGTCKGDTVVKIVTVTVNPLPSISLTDKTFCPSGTAVALGEGAPAGMASYYWSPSYMVTNSRIQNPSTLSPPPSTKTKYTLEVVDSTGCWALDTITITPTVMPVAGTNKSVCKGSSEVLGSESNNSVDTKTWSIISGPSTSLSQLSCTDCSQPVFTPLYSGNYTIRVTGTDGGCTNSSLVYITVYEFSVDISTPSPICKGGSRELRATYSSDYTYSWSPSGSLNVNNLATVTANPSETTTYTVEVHAAAGACKGSSANAEVTLVVNPLPEFSLTDKTYCQSQGPVSLGDDAPLGMSVYKWTPASLLGNANVRNASTLNPPPSEATTFNLEVTDVNGCKGSNSMTITPSIEAPYTDGTLFMCSGQSEYLGSSSNLGSDVWKIVSGPDTTSAQLGCQTCSMPLFTPLTAGTYVLSATRTIGGCSNTSSLTVTVGTFNLPELSSKSICVGNSVQIGTSTVAGAQYFWEPQTGLSNPNVSNPIATVTESTTYTLIGIGRNGCPASTNVSVLVSSDPAPSITIPNIMVVQGTKGAKMMPTVNPTGDYDYLWNPNDGTLNDIYALQPTVITAETGAKVYSLTATNTVSGCSNSASALVTVIDAIREEQVITFDSIGVKTFGDAPFYLDAVSSSGLLVSFISSDNNVAVIEDDLVTIVGAGTITIIATQGGDSEFNPATNVSRVLNVQKADQTITFGALEDKTLGDAPFVITATSSVGLPVSFYSSSDKILLVDEVTITKAGRASITAIQAGNSNYNAATSIEQSFCIKPAKPTISDSVNAEALPLLVSDSEIGNQWYLNGISIEGATRKTYAATVSGVYSVNVKVDDCESEMSDNKIVVITNTTYPNSICGVIAYPNPVMEVFTIELHGFNEGKKVGIKIFNVSGKLIENRMVNYDEKCKIDMSRYGSGLYLLQVIQDHTVIRQQFIKED